MKWFNRKRQRARGASSKPAGAANRNLGSSFARRLLFEPMEQRQLLSVTINDLAGLQNMSADLDEDYVLGANIDASGENFDPIGDSSTPFTGTFDGDGYTISGLTIDTSSDAYVGLFGYTSGADLDEVALVKADIDADHTSNFYAGGVVGYSVNTDITDSYVTGKLTAASTSAVTAYAGGLVGYISNTANKTIDGSYTDCDVDVSGSVSIAYVGGLLGYVDGSGTDLTVVDSYAMGDVTADTSTTIMAGGLVGYAFAAGSSASSVTLSRSFATGDVDGDSGSVYAGGLAGAMTTNSSFAAVVDVSIEDSYASGTVTATGSSYAYVGGLLGVDIAASTGAATSITNTYATGSATASAGTTACAGGLVGFNIGSGGGTADFDNSYATGVADATATTTFEGGFAGSHSGGTITNGWWYNATNSSGLGSGSGDVTKASAASDFYDKTQDVYDTDAPNWDFTAPADWDEFSDTYPRLAYEWETSITTLLQLQNMQLDLDATYTLANDIDASQTAGWNWDATDTEYRGFVPVGDSTNKFTGSLDGNGYDIKGLTIESDAVNYVGLFGYTNGATLDQVQLTSPDVEGNGSATDDLYVGGIAGYALNTDISYAAVIGGEVTAYTAAAGGRGYAGGVVGWMQADEDTAQITDSSTSVTTYANGGSGGDCIAGGLVGHAQADTAATSILTIDTVSATGMTWAISLDTDGHAGGLVGEMWIKDDATGTISNSYATEEVLSEGGDEMAMAGGLVGYVSASYGGDVEISESYAKGYAYADNPSGNAAAGGLVGYISVSPAASTSAKISNSYFSPEDNRDSGRWDVTAIHHAAASGYAGGLVGRSIGGDSNVDIEYSFASATVTGRAGSLGGLVGYSSDTTYTANYFNSTVFGSSDGVDNIDPDPAGVAALTEAQMREQSNFSGWDFDANGVSAGDNGDWIMAGYPHLQMEWSSSITDVYRLQMMALDLDAAYTLANNIVADDSDANHPNYDTSEWNYDTSDTDYRGFAPVGDSTTKFSGSLDGAGYTITGLTIDAAAEAYVGLFGYTDGATLDEVALVSADISATNTSNSYVGGLVGYSTDTDITDSYVTGTVTANSTSSVNIYAGGLVGYMSNSADKTISRSYTDCDVEITGTAFQAHAGGLLGHVDGSGTDLTIVDSYAMGDVTTTASRDNRVGGLVGYAGIVSSSDSSLTFSRSFAMGNVDATSTSSNVLAGGLVGTIQAGSLSSAVIDVSIEDCYASGTVLATAGRDATAGGLVGFNVATATGATTSITNSYAAGSATASGVYYAYAGGLVGRNLGAASGTANIDDSFATGLADAKDATWNYEGGFVGSRSGDTIDNCYWTSANANAVGWGSSSGISYEDIATLLAVVDDYYTHAVFDDWDFSGRDSDGTDDIWDVEGTGVLPTLSWE